MNSLLWKLQKCFVQKKNINSDVKYAHSLQFSYEPTFFSFIMETCYRAPKILENNKLTSVLIWNGKWRLENKRRIVTNKKNSKKFQNSKKKIGLAATTTGYEESFTFDHAYAFVSHMPYGQWILICQKKILPRHVTSFCKTHAKIFFLVK
jgi:hypothetical protein